LLATSTLVTSVGADSVSCPVEVSSAVLVAISFAPQADKRMEMIRNKGNSFFIEFPVDLDKNNPDPGGGIYLCHPSGIWIYGCLSIILPAL
jgi:hypothetical protein